jgi:hypothetical protein
VKLNTSQCEHQTINLHPSRDGKDASVGAIHPAILHNVANAMTWDRRCDGNTKTGEKEKALMT